MQWILAMIMPLLEKFGIEIDDLSPENIAGHYHNPVFPGLEPVEVIFSFSWSADYGSLCKICEREWIRCSIH